MHSSTVFNLWMLITSPFPSCIAETVVSLKVMTDEPFPNTGSLPCSHDVHYPHIFTLTFYQILMEFTTGCLARHTVSFHKHSTQHSSRFIPVPSRPVPSRPANGCTAGSPAPSPSASLRRLCPWRWWLMNLSRTRAHFLVLTMSTKKIV